MLYPLPFAIHLFPLAGYLLVPTRGESDYLLGYAWRGTSRAQLNYARHIEWEMMYHGFDWIGGLCGEGCDANVM